MGFLGPLGTFPYRRHARLLSLARLTTLLSLAAAPLAGAADLIHILPLAFQRPATPPLGVNLEGLADNSRSHMFIDCMKTARKFGSPDAPWDEKAPVGPDGWPTGDAGAVVITDARVQPGDYLFSCTGRCELSTPVTNARVKSLGYNRATRQSVGILTVNPGNDHLFLAFKNTDGGIKNIRLLRPGYTLASKEIFTHEFLQAIEPFSALRLMDLLRTNGSDVADWKDRTTPDSPTQAGPRGMAWEYAIDLANQSHKDLWINIPLLATDDYVRRLAALMKQKLDSDRIVYLEYSNELWNASFPQYGKNIELAQQEVAAGNTSLQEGDSDRQNKYYWGWRRTAERIVQIGQIFRDVYGADAMMTRIRPVLASQVSYGFVLRMQLAYIEQHFGPPNRFVYAVAGAPYLYLDQKTADREDLTVDQIFNPGFADALATNKAGLLEYQTLATYYRVHAFCYEGGVDLEGDHSLKAKIAANSDPRMENVVKEYLNNWYAQGGGLFMYFNLAGTYSKFGCWGLTDDIHRLDEPKMKAAIAVAAEPTPPITAGAPVPGNWMAVAFKSRSSGGRPEDDGAGGQCIASLGDRDCVDFLLNVQQEGNYALHVETAYPGDDAHLELLLSGQSVGALHCPNSGGWHKFVLSPAFPVHLSPGPLTLRLRVVGKAPNIRSVRFDPLPADASPATPTR